MARFEEVFGMPQGHTLKQTYFRSSANGSRDRWMHEEYDAQGTLVARYESWMNLTINGFAHDDGWKKFSPTGEIVATGGDLPIKALTRSRVRRLTLRDRKFGGRRNAR